MANAGRQHSPWTFIRKETYLRPLPTNQRIKPTITTTNKIPTHTPALKMPPMTSQEDKVIAIAKAQSHNKEYCFMSSSFWGMMQKLCRTGSAVVLYNDPLLL